MSGKQILECNYFTHVQTCVRAGQEKAFPHWRKFQNLFWLHCDMKIRNFNLPTEGREGVQLEDSSTIAGPEKSHTWQYPDS